MTLSGLLLTGLGLLVLLAGAEAFVRGASRLAAALGLSPLVVGLTIVSFGTSAPELAVGVRAALAGSPDVTLGNVVGSNIFNVLLVMGGAALLVPLTVQRRVVRREVPLMIAVSALLLLLARDGSIGRGEGLVLFSGILLYTGWSIWESRRNATGTPGGRTPPVRPEDPSGREAGSDAAPSGAPGETPVRAGSSWGRRLLLVAAGLTGLVVGAGWLVDGAVSVARSLHVDEAVIGLTLVAGGTSLPEAATSVVAARRGERDIAVGNAVGSNIFNILAIVGVSAAVAPGGLRVEMGLLGFDMPFMLATAVACLPILFTGWTIARWEGALFLLYYAAYLTYLVLEAGTHAALPAFSRAMWGFVLPLTGFTLLVLALRALRTESFEEPAGDGDDAGSGGGPPGG